MKEDVIGSRDSETQVAMTFKSVTCVERRTQKWHEPALITLSVMNSFFFHDCHSRPSSFPHLHYTVVHVYARYHLALHLGPATTQSAAFFLPLLPDA